MVWWDRWFAWGFQGKLKKARDGVISSSLFGTGNIWTGTPLNVGLSFPGQKSRAGLYCFVLFLLTAYTLFVVLQCTLYRRWWKWRFSLWVCFGLVVLSSLVVSIVRLPIQDHGLGDGSPKVLTLSLMRLTVQSKLLTHGPQISLLIHSLSLLL